MTRITQDIWERARDVLRHAVGEDEFNAWLQPVSFDGFDEQDGTVTLAVASDFYQRWVSRKYAGQIRAALTDSIGDDVEVEIVVRERADARTGTADEDLEAPVDGQAEAASPMAEAITRRSLDRLGRPARASRPPAERPRLNPRYTFEEFVVGESNRYAHAAAQSVADPNSQAFNPLFLYSPSGLGKTHLMQSIGHVFYERDPSARILYATSEDFINTFIESIQSKRPSDFRTQFRNVDLLLLDDVQFLMGKERTQQEVFHTFNALFDAGKKIVLTSDRPPKDLATLEDRLRSRFEWGVIADIQPPDLETRIAILRQKARQEGLRIPPEVMTYIAERVKSNIRELEGGLKRIKVYAGLHNCPITLDVAREVLAHLLIGQPQARVAIEDIQRCVCDYFEITPQQLMGTNRSKKFSQPRHIALYLCRELTDLSFPDIAQKFGGKDHTSVIYACRKIKQEAEKDPNMASIVQYLTKQVERGPAS